MSATSAFALTPVTPIPLLVAMALLMLLLFFVGTSARRLYLPFFVEDVFIYLFLVSVGISAIINGVNDPKNFNHFISYVAVVVLYLFVIRSALHVSGLSRSTIFFTIFLGVFGASFYGLVEFVSKNFFDFGIDIYMHHSLVKEYQPTYLGYFIRVRSFVEESGHFALYLNTFLPLIVYWVFKAGRFLFGLTLLSICIGAYVVTFSAAAVFSVVISCLLVSTFVLFNRPKSKRRLATASGIFVVPLTVSCVALTQWTLVEPIVQKVLLIGGGAQDRLTRWQQAFQWWVDSPLWGIGPGGASIIEGTGVVGWYLQVLSETGLIAFLVMVIFVLLVLRRILAINDGVKYAYLISFLACLIHYAVISNYWYPWLWCLIALIQLDYYHCKRGRSETKWLAEV
jgi:O-antigen ligase